MAFQAGAAIERIRVNAVSGNFFSALDIHAQLGRVLAPVDDNSGVMAAVLSYQFWQRWFAGSTAAIGQTVRLNGRAFTVVGVLPKGANGLTVDTSPDIRIPLAAARSLVPQTRADPSPFFLQIFGKLRAGITLAHAEAEIEPRLRGAYEEALIRENPKLAMLRRKGLVDSRLRLEPAAHGVSPLRAQFSRGLVLLMTGVGLLLLMACANVACLLLARSAARWQEISTLPPIRDRAAVVQPLAVHVGIDMRVLAFALSASILAALLSGLSPALQGARQDLAGALRGSRTTTSRASMSG